MTKKPLLFHFNITDNLKYIGDGEHVNAIKSGRWEDVLDGQIASALIRSCFVEGGDETVNDEEAIQVAITFLYAFIQSNFTGPSLDFDTNKYLARHGMERLDPKKELSVDGEDLNVNVKHAEFLMFAKKLLDNIKETEENRVHLKWWKLRTTCIHQQVMDELCNSLHIEFKQCVESLQENANSLLDMELETLVMIEISMGYLLFHRVQKCDYWLESIFKFLDIELKVEGLLGLRTKYQQKALPQLCLRVDRVADMGFDSAEVTNGMTKLPALLKLDDDVRLERIKFSDSKDNDIIMIPSLIQCLVLAKLLYTLKSQPKDRLGDEEVEPYITSLLHQTHGPLAVRFATLLQNIRQESNNSRTVERSLKQCEEVLMQINGNQFEINERLSYFFTTMQPPIWQIKRQLGDLMLSLGLVKTALDAYLAIQSWEDVIMCYNRLELRHKAAEIIQQELDKQPTAALYCLLGDATDNVECYETAWEFSKHSSSRAQRHWGNYYYFKQNYQQAVPHLEKSLEINPLQETTLLRLGYAAINLEKWDLAVQSYLRYTHLEPRGFESWNNLAKALIKLGDKQRAHKILNEALKCNYNNWKVWENFLIVSVDTGNFEDVINSYERLVELKEKYLDLEILKIVVNAINNDTPDAQGRPSMRLKKKMNKLLAHQCVQNGSESKVWEYAALLAENDLSRAQKLQKAYIACIQTNQTWMNSMETRLRVLHLCNDVCLASLKAINDETISNMEKAAALSQLSSARLSASACIKSIKNADPTVIDDCEQCEDLLNELSSCLEMIQSKASSLCK